MFDNSTRTYDEIAKLSKGKASYKVNDLEIGESYRFMVRSYKKVNGKVVLSGDSNIITLDL